MNGTQASVSKVKPLTRMSKRSQILVRLRVQASATPLRRETKQECLVYQQSELISRSPLTPRLQTPTYDSHLCRTMETRTERCNSYSLRTTVN